jgi:predicted enzyme related to lactoylglutathione lyase
VGERSTYTPGTFCWVDLGARDPDAASGFYAAVLDWEIGPSGGPETADYRQALVDGRPVAGIYRGQRPAPSWNSYVSVEDIEATAARAAELGAALVVGPLDVLELGRSALLRDPQGAPVALWQPGTMAGAALVNDVGGLSLNQLNTHDPEGSEAFYGALFGWEFPQVADGVSPYWGIRNAGLLNGGMMGLPPGNPAPPHWLVYFTVADVDAADAVVVDAGGQVVVPVMPAGEGRILVAMDPEGAAFAVYDGPVDP